MFNQTLISSIYLFFLFKMIKTISTIPNENECLISGKKGECYNNNYNDIMVTNITPKIGYNSKFTRVEVFLKITHVS